MRGTMIQERAKVLQNPVIKYDFEYLRLLKKQRGHTITSLAVAAGHSPTTIYQVLNGTCPSFDPVSNTNTALDGDWPTLFNRNSLIKLNSVHRGVASDKQGSGGAVSGRSAGGAGRSKVRAR